MGGSSGLFYRGSGNVWRGGGGQTFQSIFPCNTIDTLKLSIVWRGPNHRYTYEYLFGRSPLSCPRCPLDPLLDAGAALRRDVWGERGPFEVDFLHATPIRII